MAFSLKLFLLLAVVFITSEAQQRHSNISRGSSLTPANSYWLSSSGLYAFGLYKQGNGFSVGIFLAGIRQKTVVWTANRDSSPVTGNVTLLFTSEGQLILQSEQGQEYVANPSQPASSASMLDSGNFVLYNSNWQILWQSFDSPTDTLLPSQRLLTDKELISAVSESDHSTGIFRLKMQKDGNLVQYPVGTPEEAAYSYFTSWTDKKGDNVTLVFDMDGHLYLMNSTGSNMKNITDGGFPRENTTFLMRIDTDGLFRVYSHVLDQQNGSWSIEWFSSNDKCNPKGLCGLNGFCVTSGQEATCRCLPGFQVVDRGNWNSGCFTNFTAESCGNEHENPMTTIEEIPNTVWEDMSYSVQSLSGKEDCKQACLDDCNCEAAFYKDGNCGKQRLPLRYGRKQVGESNVALIKVYNTKLKPPIVEGFVPKERSNRSFRRDILITSIFLVTFGSIMMFFSIVVLHKSQFWTYRKFSTHKGHEVEFGREVAPRSYSYEELEQMTDNFKEEIGRGSFGTVYKGINLNSQQVVAVKRLGRLLEEGDIEFQNEMKAIGRTHHKNLVRLLGYCREESHRLLVYEYMANGSLADLLFREENQPSWDERRGIACGIASGILYLHEECETQIIHCDIKPQNILIDNNRCAKISDFGLAKLLMPDQTKTFTGIRGTRGYVAPEWHKRLPITVKADVYSFGIVLLEIICRRRNVVFDIPEEEEAILEDWVYNCFQIGRLQKLVNYEEIDKSQLERMVKVALWCVQEEPLLRPSMKKVLLMLEGVMEIPIPPIRNSFS
ncbi:S-receptor-like serine/threonine-protein kinase [Parasponia andersonii]|uniref:Receptor-like serine/threonine-protein kinase n=1 Tax=Parasponia andersonii TaxID=3476 RepID=A0A2P5DGU6_PARAD|nr:S-receptor-like serine/threonine-protein kinase [Parasponia andersonii]